MVQGRKKKSSYSMGLATRESILNAAAEMIAEVGYHAMSLRDLARRVGISHPAVIYHFPSKEAMIRMVLLRLEDEFNLIEVERDDAEGQLRPIGIKADTINELTSRLIAIALHPDALKLMVLSSVIEQEAGSPSHPLHAYMKERYKLIEKFVLEQIAIEYERDTMQFMAIDTYVARNLFLMWIGTKQIARMEADTANAMDLVTHFIATCIIYLKVTPATLVAFAAKLPEELAPTYVQVVANVNRYLA